MKQQVLSCIETRRSVRSYEAKQIPDDMRDEILKAAVYAPSGSNNQSWLFTAIQNRKILEDLTSKFVSDLDCYRLRKMIILLKYVQNKMRKRKIIIFTTMLRR